MAKKRNFSCNRISGRFSYSTSEIEKLCAPAVNKGPPTTNGLARTDRAEGVKFLALETANSLMLIIAPSACPLEPRQSRTVREVGDFLWLHVLQRIAPHDLTVGLDFETLSEEGRSIERPWLV